MLALPLLLIPDQLIEAWLGKDAFGESAPVMALLAIVILVHQPIYLLTQYLIARARQREIARTLIGRRRPNVVLSVVFLEVLRLWGVALATLLERRRGAAVRRCRSLAAPAAADPIVDFVPRHAAAGAARGRRGARSCSVARGLERGHAARALRRSASRWALLCGFAIWRFGLDADERGCSSGRCERRRAAAAPEPL